MQASPWKKSSKESTKQNGSNSHFKCKKEMYIDPRLEGSVGCHMESEDGRS